VRSDLAAGDLVDGTHFECVGGVAKRVERVLEDQLGEESMRLVGEFLQSSIPSG
jgi:hypothetical protein